MQPFWKKYNDPDVLLQQENRNWVLRKFPLIGTRMAKIVDIPDDRAKTAATNGKEMRWSPKFFSTIDENEQHFVTAHEYLHATLRHAERLYDREKKEWRNGELWNDACDAVVNQILKESGVELPARKPLLDEKGKPVIGEDGKPVMIGPVDIPEASGKSAEEMYEILRQREQEKENEQKGQDGKNGEKGDQSESNQGQGQGEGQDQQQGQQQQGQGKGQNQKQQGQQGKGQGQEQDQGDDGEEQQGEGQGQTSKQNQQARGQSQGNHEGWEQASKRAEREAQEEDKANEGQGEGQGQKKKSKFDPRGQEQQSQQSSAEGGKNLEPQDDAKAQKIDPREIEKNFSQRNQEIREKIAKEIMEQLHQKKNEHLKAVEEAESWGALGEAEKVVDYKKLIKKHFEKHDQMWSYRRADAENDYMARLDEMEQYERARTEIGLDASGSVDDDFLRAQIRQLKPLFKESDLFVFFFGGKVSDFIEIKTTAQIDKMPILRPNPNSTNWDAAVRKFSKDPRVNKMIITDGCPGIYPSEDLKKVKMLWLVYENKDFDPVCGKVIHVDPDEFTKTKMNYQQQPERSI